MRILLLEDDLSYANALQRRLEKLTHQVLQLNNCEGLINQAILFEADCIVLDMNLTDESSLPYIADLRAKLPQARILLVTGYASIASTVAAIKSGADDYLPKPIDFKTLYAAILAKKSNELTDDLLATQTETAVLSPGRLTWEHIQRVLAENEGNVSATARQLNMHRRTLQRKLAKKPLEY